MNSHETYISLETAKLLKQAGFDWEIDSFYRVYPEEPVKFEVDNRLQYNWNIHSNVISAPTLTIAQKWLREVKGWEIQVACGTDKNGRKTYVTELINPEIDLIDYRKYFLTYEETLESGIRKALEIILEKEE